MKTVDARGDACPIPVVKTKNAIREMKGGGEIQTLVDNEIAVQNLTKMANQKGYAVKSEKIDENNYSVTMTIPSGSQSEPSAGSGPETSEDSAACVPDARNGKTVVAIASDRIGQGNDELGHILMKSFLFALTQQDKLPQTMIFYNTGAKITCKGSPSLEDLKSLEAQGVEILTCGTCLDFQNLKEDLAVGGVTNMYEIAERLLQAGHVVRP
ncbi:MAG: sulfurtransferase-like selenium metabolism protein YedF [Bilifractor sp.]|jgi:selenium metabolism protein YedF